MMEVKMGENGEKVIYVEKRICGANEISEETGICVGDKTVS